MFCRQQSGTSFLFPDITVLMSSTFCFTSKIVALPLLMNFTGLAKFVMAGTRNRSSCLTHERFFVAWRYWSYGLVCLKFGIGNEAIGPSSLIYM